MGDPGTPVDPVAAAQVPSELTSEEKMWAMFCHLSGEMFRYPFIFRLIK